MDPNTGKVYSREEAEKLPPEIQKRLVPVPRKVRRQKREAITYDRPPKSDVEKRRAANKRAKKARKKNRN